MAFSLNKLNILLLKDYKKHIKFYNKYKDIISYFYINLINLDNI